MRKKPMTFRNTKIVATLGPASSSPQVIRDMLQAGMNVSRLNFSHGSHEQHRDTIQLLRRVSSELKNPLAILQDLSGPKLRLGEIPQGSMQLSTGDRVRLSAATQQASPGQLPIGSIPWLPKEVKPGQRILLDDGTIRLDVLETREDEVLCSVVNGGSISSHKGINLPDTVLRELKIPTDKDEADLEFGIREGVDFVALSFVRTVEDVRALKKLIRHAGARTKVIAKIEKREALTNIEDIIEESDGVMVARGDLGVETDLETVTLQQKEIISLCNRRAKVVITATQMLQSMINSPTPTRAEVSDVTNAILDGTDALMLSGETAVGQYPVESVQVMASIANKTEEVFDNDRFLHRRELSEASMSAAVAHAACLLAKELAASAIVANTESGHTAQMLSCYRPQPPILGLSHHEAIVRQLALVWGVYPFLIEAVSSAEELLARAKETALRSGLASTGDRIVMTAGVPVGVSGTTNLITSLVL
jgi:pyruvate kinase